MTYDEKENIKKVDRIKRYLEEELQGKRITKEFVPCYEVGGFLYPISDNTRIKVYMDEWTYENPKIDIEQYKDEKWSTSVLWPRRWFEYALNHFDEVIEKAEVLDFKERRREELEVQKELSWQAKIDNIKEQSAKLANTTYEDYAMNPERINEDFNKVKEIKENIRSCTGHYGISGLTPENFEALRKAQDNIASYYENVIIKEYEKISEEMENQYENLLHNDKEAIDKVDKLEERFKKVADVQERLSRSILAPKEINEKALENIQKVINEKDDSKIILYAQQKIKEREEKIREYDDRYQGMER